MSRNIDREIVTQEDVARHAGVSRAIVSYVLNNGPRNVSEETRNRVLNAIQVLGYRPNQHAQQLKLGANAAENSIGIIAGGKGSNLLERPYYSAVVASLFDRAYQLNQHIRFFSFFDSLSDPVFFNKNIHREEISSLILLLPLAILGNPEHERILKLMIERVDNIICLEQSIYNLPALILDLAGAAEMAVEHLISLGHQRIGFLSLSDDRDKGYKRTLTMHGLPYDADLVRDLDGTKILSSAYEETLDLVQEQPNITALFAANDEAAIAAIAALQDRGLRVPDDIAIASIDNTETAAIIRPALTTVNVPRREMVDYAFQFLLAQRVHPVASPASMIVPIELIVRESSGAQRR
jgi:DNA-binding LacI/PurR family transcriptional regulator